MEDKSDDEFIPESVQSDEDQEYKDDFSQASSQPEKKQAKQNIPRQNEQQQSKNQIPKPVNQVNQKEKQQQNDDDKKGSIPNQKQQPQPQGIMNVKKISDDQLAKQQLSFIDNLNQFKQREDSKEKVPNKANTNIKPTQKKVEGFKRNIGDQNIPSDEEIDSIIERNQNNFISGMQKLILKTDKVNNYIDNYADYQDGIEQQQEEELEQNYQQLHAIQEESEASQSVSNDEIQKNLYSYLTSDEPFGDEKEYKNYQLLQKQQQMRDKQEKNKLLEKKNIYDKIKKDKKQQIDKEFQEVVYKYLREDNKNNIQIQNQNKFKIKDMDIEEAQEFYSEAYQKNKLVEKAKELEERMKYGCKKCQEEFNTKGREELQEENLFLKKTINELNATISVLKVQLQKNQKNLDNSFSSNTTSSSSTAVTRKISDLEDQNERLKENNLSLRKRLTELQEKKATSLNKQIKLQHEIEKSFGKDIRSLQEKETKKKIDPEIEKKLKESNEKLCQVRLDLQKMISKYSEQKQKLKENENIIGTLKEKLSNQHFTKQVQKVQELQLIIDNNDKDKQNIIEEMAFDNQLALLFPNSINPIMHFLNICVGVEELKRGRNKKIVTYLKTTLKPFYKTFQAGFQYLSDQAKFLFTKNPVDHPSSQAIIRSTITAWNTSPEIVSRQIHSQQKELKELRIRFIEMDDEILSLRAQNIQLDKDVELLRQRNGLLENKLAIDKSRLLTNVLIQLKHHTVDDDEIDYLKEFKEIVETLKEPTPILLSQAEKDEQKRQAAIEAEKIRKQREQEEKKLLQKQEKLQKEQEKQEQLAAAEKEKKFKNRPHSAVSGNQKEKQFRVTKTPKPVNKNNKEDNKKEQKQ